MNSNNIELAKTNGTSIKEQTLFFYVQKYYPDALNRVLYDGVGELDIFIPSLNLGIEYDGLYWHKKKLDRDNEKNKQAKSLGLRLIRVRESGLHSTENAFGEVFLRGKDTSYDEIQSLRYVFGKLGKIIQDDRLLSFSLSKAEYYENLPFIYARLYTIPVEPNISNMCGIEFWDKDRNGFLSPINIPKDGWAYAFLKCKNNQSIILPRRYDRDYKNTCIQFRNGCENCVSHWVCPFLSLCHADNYKKGEIYDCDYVESRVRIMIEKGISSRRLSKSYQLDEWMWLKSHLGIKLVKEFLDLRKNKTLQEKYLNFFGYQYRKEMQIGFASQATIKVRNIEEKSIVHVFTQQLKYASIDVEIHPALLKQENLYDDYDDVYEDFFRT